MGNLVNYVTDLHKATSRAYIDRMTDDKANCMIKAKEYGFDYWDGSRRFGYGGYKYIPGRWKPVAELLIKNYKLTNDSSVLDVGCGKAFLLYEMKLLLLRKSTVCPRNFLRGLLRLLSVRLREVEKPKTLGSK